VIAKLDLIHLNQTQDVVPLAYSGGGMTLVKALNDRGALYDQVKNVIIVGAPVNLPLVPATKITNPNIQRVINVYGDKDPLQFMFSNNLGAPEQVNIVLKGISHTEYFYSPKLKEELQKLKDDLHGVETNYVLNQDTQSRIHLLKTLIYNKEQSIERTLYADAFMARLTRNASNENDWRDFVAALPALKNGIIELDPKDFAGFSLSVLKSDKGL
jgi:hypothetical protein